MLAILAEKLAQLSVVLGLLSTALAAIPSNEIIIEPPRHETDIWAGYPLLKAICACESSSAHPWNEPRQFINGKPLWSLAGTPDVGACQISLKYHATTTYLMELDVMNSFEDNVAYAKYLFDKEGTKPWRASQKCWQRWIDADGVNLSK